MLRELTLVRVDDGADEAEKLAALVVTRATGDYRPAILAVRSPQAVIEDEGFLPLGGIVEDTPGALAIVRVHGFEPALSQRLLGRLTRVFLPAARNERAVPLGLVAQRIVPGAMSDKALNRCSLSRSACSELQRSMKSAACCTYRSKSRRLSRLGR